MIVQQVGTQTNSLHDTCASARTRTTTHRYTVLWLTALHLFAGCAVGAVVHCTCCSQFVRRPNDTTHTYIHCTAGKLQPSPSGVVGGACVRQSVGVCVFVCVCVCVLKGFSRSLC